MYYNSSSAMKSGIITVLRYVLLHDLPVFRSAREMSLVAEVRQDFVPDDVLLRAPRVELQARKHVGSVHLAVVGEPAAFIRKSRSHRTASNFLLKPRLVFLWRSPVSCSRYQHWTVYVPFFSLPADMLSASLLGSVGHSEVHPLEAPSAHPALDRPASVLLELSVELPDDLIGSRLRDSQQVGDLVRVYHLHRCSPPPIIL